MAQGIHAWWLWATQALASETSDEDCQNWVLTALLPWVYWTQQANKTRQPDLKRRYQQAVSDAFQGLITHPFTALTDNLTNNAGVTGVTGFAPSISAPLRRSRAEMAIFLNATMSPEAFRHSL